VHRILTVAGVGLLLATASGCSTKQPFRIECTVVDSTTRELLSGVRVVLDTAGSPTDPIDPDRGIEIGRTKSPGRVDYLLEVPEAARPTRERRWLLKASLEGYAPEQVDFSPSKWPARPGESTPIILMFEMKPLPPKAEK
jgi:hypothetical protein